MKKRKSPVIDPLIEVVRALDDTWTDEYVRKLVRAKAHQKSGLSLREIAKLVGIDRESMSKNLKRFD